MEPATKRIKMNPSPSILIIEPFYGGSHKQMLDLITAELPAESHLLLTLPAKKWKWRLRTSCLFFAQKIPREHSFKVLFASSMLNLAELLACRPDLYSCKKVVYFHENQFEYPVQPGAEKERDIQFGWSQAISCMAADRVLFNSTYNLESLMTGLEKAMKMMPKEQQVTNITTMLVPKCSVLYFPLKFSDLPNRAEPVPAQSDSKPLHIVWNHRWEWDKGPDDFFKAISLLESAQVDFKISVLGESFGEVPPIFEHAKAQFASRILNWGYLPTKEDYLNVLLDADTVVSTAHHEFFGVSVIEAISCGCFPLCPRRLVFPEYLPDENLYNTVEQLVKQLRYHARYPGKLRASVHQWRSKIDLTKFDWNSGQLRSRFLSELLVGVEPN